MPTLADKWYAEGIAEGISRGIAEGISRGRADVVIETLLRQARRRFGEVPAYAEARIRAASPGQLDAWIDSVLDAEDIAAIVGPPGGH